MKRSCHVLASSTWRARQQAVAELLHRATVVTDPKRLAYLNARVAQRATPAEDALPRRKQHRTEKLQSWMLLDLYR